MKNVYLAPIMVKKNLYVHMMVQSTLIRKVIRVLSALTDLPMTNTLRCRSSLFTKHAIGLKHVSITFPWALKAALKRIQGKGSVSNA